jgi:hypothetical protein
MSRARFLPVPLLVLAFAAAACSSSGGSIRADKGGTPSTAANASADLALAKSAVLQPGDLSDYRASAHTPAADIPAAEKRKFAQCMGTSTTVFDKVPGAQSADSPDFSKGDTNNQQVTSSVEIDPTAAEVEQGWNEFTAKKAQPCLEKLFQVLFGPGRAGAEKVKFGPVQVSQFNVGVGDRSVGYALSRSAVNATQTVQLDVDFVYVTRGRAGMEFHFFNLGPNPDREREKMLVQKVYDRIGDKAA